MYSVARQLWNVPCTAHHASDGQPCRAWSVRGGYVCVSHGGAAPQVRAQAEFRLGRDRLTWQVVRGVARTLRALDARLCTDPEAVHAETAAWLTDAGSRIRQFRREHGRRPRNSELAGLLG